MWKLFPHMGNVVRQCTASEGSQNEVFEVDFYYCHGSKFSGTSSFKSSPTQSCSTSISSLSHSFSTSTASLKQSWLWSFENFLVSLQITFPCEDFVTNWAPEWVAPHGCFLGAVTQHFMPVQGILPQDTLTALLTFKRFPHLHLTVAGSPMAAPVGPLSGPVVMAFEWFVVVASCLGPP